MKVGAMLQRLWPVALLLLLGLAWLAWAHGPDASWLQAQRQAVLALKQADPWGFGIALFLLFTLLSALALPGCSLLALAAGLCYGWLLGTLMVALASTLGATLSFLVARHWLRGAVRQRWGARLTGIEAGLARDGGHYLFSLRLAPVIPYALINPLMGLSAMPVWQFFLVSLLGMLAGSAAYVYAGTLLGSAQAWQEVFSPQLLASLLLLALLPWLARAAWRRARLRVRP